MTTFIEVATVRKRVRDIMYSWIGIVEITELKRLLAQIDRMLNEYQKTLK
jgi:hypothetical protein